MCGVYFPTMIFNCSQTKFVAIILVLSVFFYAIFCLTDFSSDAFDFSSSKTGWTGSAQRALSALRAFQLCFSSNCFGDLYLWCEGRFLKVEDTPSVDPPYCPTRPPTRCFPPPQCCPPISPWCNSPPPLSWLATDEQPLAKNANLYFFAIFFKLFEHFWQFLIFISLRCQKTSSRVR